MIGRTRTARPDRLRRLLMACGFAGLLVSARADAAAVMAIASKDRILIGESTQITITLNLKAGEVASGYAGRFDIGGLGSVVEMIEEEDVEIGGPTWDTEEGPTLDDHRYDLGFELGSENQGGTRLVAMLQLTGLAEGEAELMMGSGSRGVQDIDEVPFVDEVWLDPLAGAMLTRIVVVPEPATLLLSGAGLAAVALRRRRRR